MKEVKINGFSYWYEETPGKLWEDKAKTNEVPQNHMTKNEKDQLELWTNYNGIPMISY